MLLSKHNVPSPQKEILLCQWDLSGLEELTILEGIQQDIDAAQDTIDAAVMEQDALLVIRKRNTDLNKKISKFFGS